MTETAANPTLPPFDFVGQEYDPAVPIGQLTPHPANPNEGDQGLLSDVITANGFAGAVLAQKSTGIIIDGETRYRVAVARNVATLPVLWADVDDDTRDRFLAEWNETTRRGRNDESKLLALLQGLVQTPHGLAGAAFDGDDMDRLVSILQGPPELPDAPTGARNAEDQDEEDARRDTINGYRDRKEDGALVEMIMVFTAGDRAEVGKLLDSLRTLIGDQDLRGADLMLRALRVYEKVLTTEGAGLLAAAATDETNADARQAADTAASEAG